MLTLKAEKRDSGEKPEAVRKTGRIPAVFYGKKEPSTPIAISMSDFLKVWKAGGESTVIKLETPEGEKESLIHDIDFDPVSGTPRHADFYVFEKGLKVMVNLPIEFEGASTAVKEQGGVLTKVLYEIEVEAQPKDLPHNLVIDISVFVNIGDQIFAGDIPMPHGVELVTGADEVVALVAAPREEKEEEAAPIDLESIVVE